MNRHGAYLFYPRPQEAADEELEALKFRLYDDETEIGLRVHVPRLLFHELDLPSTYQHSGSFPRKARASHRALSRLNE